MISTFLVQFTAELKELLPDIYFYLLAAVLYCLLLFTFFVFIKKIIADLFEKYLIRFSMANSIGIWLIFSVCLVSFLYVIILFSSSYPYLSFFAILLLITACFFLCIKGTIPFIQWIVMLTDGLWKLGDTIKINDHLGKVRSVRLTGIQLVNKDGNIIKLPLHDYFRYPVTFYNLKNYSFLEFSFTNKDDQLPVILEQLDEIRFELLNLPFGIDSDSLEVYQQDDFMKIKIKFWPAYIETQLRQSIIELVETQRKKNKGHPINENIKK
ncbi:MAG: mechanosensitive ion channel [Oligoflexia bacterium]|nr:mechanosensitive ion channel [Oligoflexia bacterium]